MPLNLPDRNVYFNSRSRTGSDVDEKQRFMSVSISIHAPAQGATDLFCRIVKKLSDFNSRSRTGSDKVCKGWHTIFSISIHAPAQGATLRALIHRALIQFQFTLPHRERLS